jgi:hypothetical protein
LPFNVLAASKYTLIGLDAEYPYKSAKRQSKEAIDKLAEIASEEGVIVITEGQW